MRLVLSFFGLCSQRFGRGLLTKKAQLSNTHKVRIVAKNVPKNVPESTGFDRFSAGKRPISTDRP
jgi:hypothetical protein